MPTDTDQIAHARAQTAIQARIAGLMNLSDWLNEHPDMPADLRVTSAPVGYEPMTLVDVFDNLGGWYDAVDYMAKAGMVGHHTESSASVCESYDFGGGVAIRLQAHHIAEVEL